MNILPIRQGPPSVTRTALLYALALTLVFVLLAEAGVL